jgi:hypothetical protein
MVAFILLVVGGLNWLLVGAFDTNLVENFFGNGLTQIIYILVGLSAIVEVVNHKKTCRYCNPGGNGMGV